MKAFIRSLWGEIADRTVEALVLAAGIVYLLIKTRLSWSKLLEGRWDVFVTAVWVISGLVVWHAFRSAISVAKEIREESATWKPQRSPILSPSGHPVEMGATSQYVYARFKLYGIAVCLTVLAVTASYFTWLKVPKQVAAPEVKPVAGPVSPKTGPPMRPDVPKPIPHKTEPIFPEPAERADLHFIAAEITFVPHIKAKIMMRHTGKYSVLENGLIAPTVFVSHSLFIAEEDAFFLKKFSEKGSGAIPVINSMLPGDQLVFVQRAVDRRFEHIGDDPMDLLKLLKPPEQPRAGEVVYVTTQAFFRDKLGWGLRTESCCYYEAPNFNEAVQCWDHNK